jgi:hypothetical protein
MSTEYDLILSSIVNEFISKESLCMLLLASSILFYNMAEQRDKKIPVPYALSISVLLILYSVVIGIHSGREFSYSINNIIQKCKHEKCNINIKHFEKVRNFYVNMAIVYAFILIFITYVLIRFD